MSYFLAGFVIQWVGWSLKTARKVTSDLENPEKNISVENPGIDPGTSRMLSERSTI